MAAKSGQDADNRRAGLPFEPKGKKASGKKAGKGTFGKPSSDKASSETAKPTQKSSKKEKVTASDVSARSQARADEILASNRRRAKKQAAKSAEKSAEKSASSAIPKEVSNRMLRRMAVLSGSPVFLGVGIFFLAYYLQSNQIVEFPAVAVLLVTMGCFGLGVLGLTYGVLSASWDSEPGSLIGLSEFKLNFSRIMEARKASKT